MASNLFSRYIWIIDTLKRYGRVTRTELDELWKRSALGDGQPLPRRTFYNYRNAIAELFGLNIVYDSATYEYSLSTADAHLESVTNWMLNSLAVGDILSDASDVAARIFIEEVPSARQFLQPVISAMKEKVRLQFSYLPYSRVNETRDILFEPYFLKLFRQRWYVTGLNLRDEAVKTYALDRMTQLQATRDKFEIPEGFDAEAYTRDSFGIVFDEGSVRDITLRVDPRQAKYLRALPLHHSQQESVHHDYSIFRYRMKITGDLVQELMSMGPAVTVLAPAELRAWMQADLEKTLEGYQQN